MYGLVFLLAPFFPGQFKHSDMVDKQKTTGKKVEEKEKLVVLCVCLVSPGMAVTARDE